jgi:hypothetical protein
MLRRLISAISARFIEMFTADYGIVIEPAGPPLRQWLRETVARRWPVEVYERTNAGRMNTRSVALMENGYLIDRYADGQWLSGYAATVDDD